METCSISPFRWDGDQIHYSVTIFDRTVHAILTSDPQFVDSWITRFQYSDCSGIGTSSSKTRLFRPPITGLIIGLDITLVDDNDPETPVATVQLCVNAQCLIYHIYTGITLPTLLPQFITNPRNAYFALSGFRRKLSVLQDLIGFFGAVPARNVGFLAAVRYKRPELVESGLTELALTVLRKWVELPEVKQRWDSMRLSDEQVMHACIGAFLSYELGKVLL